MKRYKQIVILTALLWVLFPLVLQAAPVGKVTAIEGRVDLTSPGKEARDLLPGDPVNVGDFIRTKSKSKCEVTFIDGNILRLAESTRIQISEYMIENDKRQETISLLRGKIRSIIQKGLHALGTERGGHYEVRTPTAVLGVRGSDVINYYLNGLSGGFFIAGYGYCYAVLNPQDSRDLTQGQTWTIYNASGQPVIRSVNQQQLQQYIQDTTLGGAGETTTSSSTTATTAATTVATTVGPGGGLWTGEGLGTGGQLTTTVILSTTMETTTSISPVTTVLPFTTTILPTTVLPTTTTTVATTSPTTTTVAPTTTIAPTTTVATTSSTTVATTTTTTTVQPTTTTTSTTSTTTTSIPAGSQQISGNITGLSTNPVAASGWVFNTGAQGSLSASSAEPIPATNPWTIAPFAGAYGTGGGTFDGFFAGFNGSWQGLYHAIYFEGGNAGYTWGGMGDATGTVFTGTGPTYGGATIGPSVGTTLTAWTQPPPRFGTITISAGAATFGTTGGTYNSSVKGVDLVGGLQKMGVWGTTSAGSTFNTDGSATWQGIYYRADPNYEMVGRVYGSTSAPYWSIGPSGGNDSILYYMDDTNFGKLLLNYRAKGVGGVYVMAGAGSYFLDALTYGSTLTGPVVTGPQSLTGRMGVVTPASGTNSLVHFLGTSALADQSVWMNTISNPEARGSIVGFKQKGTTSEVGVFSYRGVLYGLYYEDGMRGYVMTDAKSDYNDDPFKMTGPRERQLLSTAANTYAADQDITATTGASPSPYSTGRFQGFSNEPWGIFSSYLTGTTWSSSLVAEANNGDLYHMLNLHTGAASPPSSPSGSPGGSAIGEMKVPGAWMSINQALTGVSGGQLFSKGPASGWTAVAAGGWIETNQFITWRGSLTGAPANSALFNMLNVPYNYIGQVALSSSPGTTNVNMDAYFYGYSTGPPRIFISDNVTGSTSVNPTGVTVTLSGAGFAGNVDFTFTNWNTSVNTWAATVNTTAAGQLNPSVGPWTHMKGYSAGTTSAGPTGWTNISGTAAGVAVP